MLYFGDRESGRLTTPRWLQCSLNMQQYLLARYLNVLLLRLPSLSTCLLSAALSATMQVSSGRRRRRFLEDPLFQEVSRYKTLPFLETGYIDFVS